MHRPARVARTCVHAWQLAPHCDSVRGMGDLVGQSLAHFRIVEKLGEGGMGVVYRATDEKLRRTLALKVLPDSFTHDEDRRRRFLREARAAAAVSHPNIAAVHDIGEADGRIFIAMEYVEGETLRERLGGGALAVPAALAIALQIARGLAKAHQANIVHRDLKPENVIIGENEHVKLLDFGLAKLGVDAATPSALEAAETETNLTREGKLLGTPGYMSPEQARGQEVDARTDVFAFGVVLYEMLTGQRPFVGETTQDVLTAVMRDTPKWASEVNSRVAPEMDRLIERCLEKLRDARYAGGAELLDALSAVPPEPRVSEPGRKAPSRPTVSLVTPVAAVAGVGTSSPSSPPGLRPLTLLGVAGWRWATHVKPATLAPTASVSPAPSRRASEPPSSELLGGALPSSNPDAQRLFEEAMRSFHDGTGQAVPLLEAAVKADTSFAAAYLRLWWLVESAQTLWPGGHIDEYHRRVLALQSRLSPRDRAFLECEEETSPVRKNAMLDAYLARYPYDDLAWVARLDGTLATAQRAVSAAPTLAPALANYARNLQVIEWRDDEAAVVIARCLELSPQSTDCLSARVKNRNTKGDCAAGEADVRRWLQLQPDSRTAPAQLSGFLAERGAPVSALREALGADPFSYGEMDEIREALIPMYEGDFAEVERVAKEAFARVPQKASQSEHLDPALTLVHANAEMGDLAGAASVASDYLSRSAVWGDARFASPSEMVAAAARGGRMDRAEASRRIEANFEQDKELEPPIDAWTNDYAPAAETRTEALAAVAKLEALGLALPKFNTPDSGRVLFLVDRGADARPRLERHVGACTSRLLNTRNWVHSHLYLGELDEQAGNKPSACAHYAKVLERWGHAKPRSVTADEAREHAKALGCGK
jgi:eukaryotic-like serine/threonine-protein kinase